MAFDGEFINRTFDFDKPFPVPNSVSHRVLDGRHLFIATEIPAWIAPKNDCEAEIIERLLNGATIGEARDVLLSYGIAEDDATHKLGSLLEILIASNFMSGTFSDDQRDYGRLQIHITNRCNLRCPHCYVSSGNPFPEELDLKVWVEVLDEMSRHFSHVNVSISGGEPLSVPWLRDLLYVAKIVHKFDTAILTNGLLWTESRTAELAPLVDYVAVSLDGATAAIHDRIRGTGSFEKTLRALHRMNEANLHMVLNVTLMESNKADLLNNLYPLVSSLPFLVDVDVANYIAEGRGADTPEEVIQRVEFQRTLAQLVAPFTQRSWNPLPYSVRYNCGYGNSLAIYANGDVSPCLTPRFIRGNILQDGVAAIFRTIWQQANDASVNKLPLCRTCDVRYLCGGQCHLPQLITMSEISQNDCSQSYRDRFYRSLIERHDIIANTAQA